MGFERNYQIKIPSKQLNYYSTLPLRTNNNSLNPWFVTGLADAEGTFTIVIDKCIKRTLGWRVQAKFQVGLHERDLALLLQVQEFFGGKGSISKTENMIYYSVSSVKDLTNTIIPGAPSLGARPRNGYGCYAAGAGSAGSFFKLFSIDSKSSRFYAV